MNQRKRNYIFITCIVIGIGLLLWMESNKDFTHPEREVASTSPESADNMAEEGHSIQIPNSWKEEIDPNNRIDAAIIVPESICREGFRSATAEIRSVDTERVLLALEDYYHPRKGEELEYVIQYRGEDNMYLYFSKSGDEISLSSDFRDYVSMAYRDQGAGVLDSYNRDLYPVDQDLENFTINECDEILLNFFENIGLDGEVSIIHWALDYETMEREARELHPDGSETKPDYPWASDDNSYYCTVSQTCNGIPLIQSYWLAAYGDILNVSGHTFVVNRERLVSFNITEIYDIRYGEQYENLMEFSDILEKYRQYTSLSMQDYETVVTDITMRAIAVDQGDGIFQITPIWIFYGYWHHTAEDVTGPHAIFINAITGERL